jgi:hypothetical protein
VDHTSRLRNRIIGGMIAMALIPIAFATGGAAAEGDEGDLAFDPAPALEGDVLDETLGGEEALAILEAGGHVEEVAANVGWTPDQLRAELTNDDSLHVEPDGRLLYVEMAAEFTAETPESPEVSAAFSEAAAAYSDAETFTLHSLPSSTKTIYLDFDGLTRPRQDGSIETLLPFDLDGTVDVTDQCYDAANPACFSSEELAAIREIWVRVAEYYAAFDVDVTTEDPGIDALRADYCTSLSEGYVFCPPGMTPDGQYPVSVACTLVSTDVTYDLYTCPRSGWTPVPGDQEYGTRVVFTSGAADGTVLCLGPGAVGCASVGTFRRNEWHWITPSPERPLDPKALVKAGPGVVPTGYLAPSRLAAVAAHEIGHVVGLEHEPYANGSYSCQSTVDGAIYSALMHPCVPSLGADPRQHFTPQICPSVADEASFGCNASFSVAETGYRDSYGWMALNGLFARADEASPVVASGSSFTGSGVISPPLITQRPFYAPSRPLSERELRYIVGQGLEYGGGLNLNPVDATGRDVGSIIDTLDDALPLRSFVAVIRGAEYEVWVVSSVTVSPDGVRHVTAVRNTYLTNDSDVVSYGFPAGAEVIVRVIGDGASGPMDTDAYDFTVTPGAGPTDIRVTPAPTSNLDAKATLYRILADGTLEEVAVSDPPATRLDPATIGGLDASISATLAAGNYRLVVEGAGLPGVYTNYGSIGTYTVSIDTAPPAPCGVGTWSATGTEPCTPAAPGSFVATEAATEANLCAVGSFQDQEGQSSCVLAPAGYFVSTVGAVAATACPAGKYQDQVGQSSCISAPIGFYVGTVGAVAATACPSGTTTLQEGATSEDSCVSVIAYEFTGFSSPIDGGGVLNQVKAGQTVPLRWRLTTADGLPVTDLDPAGVRVTVTGLSCSVGSTVDAVDEYSTGSSGLQNLGDGYYQWNWKTAKSYAGSCKTMTLSLGEYNVTHDALFKFTR